MLICALLVRYLFFGASVVAALAALHLAAVEVRGHQFKNILRPELKKGYFSCGC
jgi:hypothetical protein